MPAIRIHGHKGFFLDFLNVCFSYSIGFTGVCAAKHCEHIIHIVRRNSDGVIECVIGAVDVKIVALLGVHARQGLLLRETVAAADAPKAHGFIRKNGDHTAAKGDLHRLQTASERRAR